MSWDWYSLFAVNEFDCLSILIWMMILKCELYSKHSFLIQIYWLVCLCIKYKLHCFYSKLEVYKITNFYFCCLSGQMQKMKIYVIVRFFFRMNNIIQNNFIQNNFIFTHNYLKQPKRYIIARISVMNNHIQFQVINFERKRLYKYQWC